MRKIDDVLCAVNAGADAIGLIFYDASPRAVSIEQAILVSKALPPFVSTVALFVNANASDVQDVLVRVRPSMLQFHGDEDPAYCAQFGVPFLKAIRVGPETTTADLLECSVRFQAASALLLDTLSTGTARVYGGTGEQFNWKIIPDEMRSSIVLSGGLNEQNVAGAVRMIRPWAVDVSSGVEVAGGPKGVKDHARISKFIEEVRNADVA